MSLPTFAALIDDEGVLAAIHDHAVENSRAGRHVSDEAASDPELARWLEEMMVNNVVQSVEERDAQLRDAISAIRNTAESDLLRAARDFRNTFLAHALTEKQHPQLTTQYGDERLLLEKTVPIVDDLYLSVSQSGFDWSGAKDISKRYAEALWHGCTFEVLS